MLIVTATEFKGNLGKYLTLVATEDIIITKNGKNVAKLSSTRHDRVEIAKSLFGIIPNDGEGLEKHGEKRHALDKTLKDR